MSRNIIKKAKRQPSKASTTKTLKRSGATAKPKTKAKANIKSMDPATLKTNPFFVAGVKHERGRLKRKAQKAGADKTNDANI